MVITMSYSVSNLIFMNIKNTELYHSAQYIIKMYYVITLSVSRQDKSISILPLL